MRVVSALYRNIQSRKGAGAPPHHPDVSFRGAKRRGNLLQPVTFSPRPTCYPIWYCEIATAPLGPRNDNLGVLAILATAGTSRSCSAGRGMPRPYNGGYGRRSSRKFATAIGAQYPQGARRIRKAAKPPTAAQGTPLQTQSVGAFLSAPCTNWNCLPEIATSLRSSQ